MRTWRSPMSAASQGAFVAIPEVPPCDISYIIKFVRKGLYLRAENGKILYVCCGTRQTVFCSAIAYLRCT